MDQAIDEFYLDKEEPIQGCLFALRDIILRYNPEFQQVWKYRLPCFLYQGSIFCYLWVEKKSQFPYIAIGKGVKIDHPELVQGNRTFVKLFLVNPEKDIPVKTIYEIFDLAMELYES